MKSYITEFLGTFVLVLVIGLTANPIAIGAIIAVLVYAGIHISGAHYNPAVSIAMILRGLLSKKDAIYYIISQLAGAFLAALFVFWSEGELMKIKPSDIATVFQILSVEFIFTFILIIVILYVATEKSTAGNSYYGLAIGFTILVASFVGGEISGGAFNPAVGTGPILVEIIIGEGSTLTNLWYYIVGPIIGAVVASYVYKLTTD